MAHNEMLAIKIRDYFRRHRTTAEEKRMMGGLCFMVRDKMCVGVHQDKLMVRLDPADRPAALKRPGCTPMQFTGRTMRGFVVISPAGWTAQPDFDFWLALALAFNPRAVSSKKRAKAQTVARPAVASRHRKDQGDSSD